MTASSPNLLFGTIDEARTALADGSITSTALTQSVFDHIEAIEADVHAFIRLDRSNAMEAAKEADQRREQGATLGPLDGIPISIKDQIVTKGLETTAGSKILSGYIPPYDATVVQRLKKAGAIILGKNNQDEFAMGSSTEYSAYGATSNPYDLSRVPGGSSGGSAAAVAAGAGFASLGTDTGGSIRQPAAFCGVVGVKPTYGRVSRFGSIAFASSLDQIGPITRTVRDAAHMLQAIGGPDPRDSTCRDTPMPDLLSSLEDGAKGLRIGIVKEAFEPDGLDPEISSRVMETANQLAAAGAELVPVSIPSLPHAIAAYYLTATAEASSNLARYDGVRYGQRADIGDVRKANLVDMYNQTRSEGFGPEVKRRILLGTYALSAGYYDAFYVKAQRVRTLIGRDFQRAFQQCDALCLPTSPVAPFAQGERTADPLQMYLADIYTIACNLARVCAVSVPAGLDASGLPVGVQFICNHMQEPMLLRVARACEVQTGGYNPPTPIQGLSAEGG
ncbi:MAG: Asp-tRNA(Asn)/Glu-tRNA(Gln) amidotransferase GatCAB subunit A [Myxococcales bacterium]|nr:Asp-tRNA(Asn)/Glu-tRNA(Gln) amidotransferase GatCAB subunit A [Myxococcales bacterium]